MPASTANDRDNQFCLVSVVLLVLAFFLLTALDLVTTLVALAGGGAVELNPNAANQTGGIRIGFLVGSNVVLLVPLTAAFALGIRQAAQVPASVLQYWWRHILDVFFVSPLNDAARLRRPLRLVTAALTLLVLKCVIVASNLLVVAGLQNPTSLLAAMWTQVGLVGAPRYWAAYALLIMPCYVAAIGLAAITLRAAQSRRAAGLTPQAA